MASQTYRNLLVWQRAMDMVIAVYDLSRTPPPELRFGLTGQMRCAAVPIPANSTEDCGRTHRAGYLGRPSIAHRSYAELDTYPMIAPCLGLLIRDDTKPVCEIAQEVRTLLNGPIYSVKQDNTN